MSRQISVAILDDNHIFVAGLSKALENMKGLDILCCEKDITTLEKSIGQKNALPDICLLGLNFPDVHYYKIIERLKALLPETKILVMTVHTHEFNIVRLLQQGADGHLPKRCDEKELEKAILTLHYSGSYYNGIVGHSYDPYIKEHTAFLSPREAQFLALLCSEMSYSEIADAMHVDNTAITGFRDILFSKLKVNSRIGLVVSAYIMGVNKAISSN